MASRWLQLTLLFTLSYISTNAQEKNLSSLVAAVKPSSASVELEHTLVVVPRDSVMKAAYRDAFEILSRQNRCSEFYGGPAIARVVLNELVSHVQYGYLPVSISFEMKGAGTFVTDLSTGAVYRRFEKMTVNYHGAFYKDRDLNIEKTPRVGAFPPNTRPARTLILLHEMGHLIRKNGAWLIPDDGGDWWRSIENTRVIEQTCRQELQRLDK